MLNGVSYSHRLLGQMVITIIMMTKRSRYQSIPLKCFDHLVTVGVRYQKGKYAFDQYGMISTGQQDMLSPSVVVVASAHKSAGIYGTKRLPGNCTVHPTAHVRKV